MRYLEPQEKILGTKWFYIYAYGIILVQIVYDILLFIAPIGQMGLMSAQHRAIHGTGLSIVPFSLIYFVLFVISILYRIKCTLYLKNFRLLSAYRIIKFYHLIFYILLFSISGILLTTNIHYSVRNSLVGGMVFHIIIFIIWSIPNLIYFRRRLNIKKYI